MGKLWSLVLLFTYLWPSLSWAQTSVYHRCDEFRALTTQAVEKHFPEYFQYEVAWRAQLYQESLCDPDAVSHAGAQGIAQIMPFHSDRANTFFRRVFDPFDPKDSIDYGAYYMKRKFKTWCPRYGRTPMQCAELAWASYNSGTGNVLKAQSKCRGAITWTDISKCQHLVTGHHAKETITYVDRITKHSYRMAIRDIMRFF